MKMTPNNLKKFKVGDLVYITNNSWVGDCLCKVIEEIGGEGGHKNIRVECLVVHQDHPKDTKYTPKGWWVPCVPPDLDRPDKSQIYRWR